MTASANPTNKSLQDSSKCPLCGNLNQCSMAAEPGATSCWCESVIFPDELLAKIPEGSVRKTCVCKKCLEAFLESQKAADTSA